ncbi:MAG: hypothetical protein GXP33_09065 [Spirochaetes bacterium]|nr:hypothetical protein [Spirochaetota bacterium]
MHSTFETVNEDILVSVLNGGSPAYRVYEPSGVHIVLGAGGKAERELYLDRAETDGIPVLRRKGGGGTVVLSPGQIVVALAKRVSTRFKNVKFMREINRWIMDALTSAGIGSIEHAGISDLAVGRKKILGSSLYRRKYVLFYQGSLLVNNDKNLFDRYLRFPDRVPDYRSGRGHSEFCTTLSEEGYAVSVLLITERIRETIRQRIETL